MLELTAKNVDAVFRDCLFGDEEDRTNHIIVEGIVNDFGLHPKRLESHRDEIIELLSQLPDGFRKESGGGWSFLNACVTKNGSQWGEHIHVEQLVTLGIGIGKVEYCLPRDMWKALPGGVPYFVVKE